ncbi:MAG: DUF3467 domain-containing protein [Actinobacteria bacterium]|nr:DUF3467 domain-containing protein [Actinomycetota bacterium]
MAAGEATKGTPDGGSNGHKRTDLKLRVPEQVAGGAYANSMMVQHTASEFVMDFAMVMGGNGQVVARVVTSPGHMKHIVAALTENIRKYEAAHGPIGPRPKDE